MNDDNYVGLFITGDNKSPVQFPIFASDEGALGQLGMRCGRIEVRAGFCSNCKRRAIP